MTPRGWAAFVPLFVLTSCGRVGFDAALASDRSDASTSTDAAHDATFDAPSIDAPSHDAPSPDAAPDAAAVTLGPFGEAAPVAVLNTGSNDDDPSLTGDLLEIYFDSGRAGGAGGGDIWMSSRASVDATWETPSNVAEVNSAGDDATPFVTLDGLHLYLVSNRGDTAGAKDVYMSERATRTSPWSTPARIAEIATAGDDAGPAITGDHLSIYWASDAAGLDDLYASHRELPTDPWGPPFLISELSTSSSDGEPWANENGTVIVFASDRPGGSGASDLYRAVRPPGADVFLPPEPIAELNTGANETDPWLSPDERVIFFSRDGDIYTAER